ncbi:MAG: hypothetical protein HYT16_02430 [DPANN group archaeon]|nr:hypothetical protein [DPANN group archaeon]
MRRAQFWAISIILLFIVTAVIFTYVRSSESASVRLFAETSDLELQNAVNAIKARNGWLASTANDWFNLNWNYRKLVELNIGADSTVEFNAFVNDAGKVGSCVDDVRVTWINGSERQSNVSATSPPCNITIVAGAGPQVYYVYYSNPSAATPSYRLANTVVQGTETDAVAYAEVEVPTKNLCTHLNELYPKLGIATNCSLRNTACAAPATQANITLVMQSTDMFFNGTIQPPPCP